MSASVASSAVGLLDRHYSPPSMSPEPMTDAQDWREPMEADRPAKESTECNQPRDVPTQKEETRAQADDDRRDTIGGLLAALATKNVSPNSIATAKPNEPVIPSTTDNATLCATTIVPAIPPRKSASPPADSPISQISQIDMQAAASKEEGAPANNGSNSAHLPPLDSNTNDELAPSSSALQADSAFISQRALHSSLMSEISADDIRAMQKYQEEHPVSLQDFDMHMSTDVFPQDQQPYREATPVNVKRQYDAFARLEFADGIFYLNTYQCELGRDQHAYKDAVRREQEAKKAAEEEQNQPKSSSGKASQRLHSIKAAESQVQRSVVSESGGFAGVDEKPIETYGDKPNGQDRKHHSQASDSSIVRPAEVLHNPSLAPFDYHKDVVYQPAPVPENEAFEDERPAPVTADHMPDPHRCPLIPIHPTLTSGQSEADNMRNISRRHIRIEWDWNESAFFMVVLGRNGAFFGDEYLPKNKRVRLYSGASIQISAVQFTFRLPNTILDSTAEDDESVLPGDGLDASPNGTAQSMENSQAVRLKLKLNADSSAAQPAAPNGELKRRGPGRPPKNGVMSQREMKEREKEAKARALQSGSSPPALQRKPSKSQPPKPEPILEPQKPEKRKYTKRKREDGEEEDVVLQSIEPQDETPVVENPTPAAPPPPAKRARTKSYSPPYKPFEECTPEDLARPPHNYAVLLYMVLTDTGEITLRQIYKQMQSRWPFFKYVVDSDGWTSSVRHNLNQEVGKLFERGRKEGKGFTWLPKPNAMEEYQAQKNKRSNAPPAPKPRPPTQRPSFPPNQGQQLTWQNSGPVSQQNRPGNGFVNQGTWGAQQNNANRPTQNGGSTSASHANGQPHAQGLPNPPQQPVHPNFVPRDEDMHKYLKHPTPRFMPVTFEGMAVIHRFQETMMKAVATDAEKETRWQAIFDSVRRRCLHGATQSSLPGGEIPDEKMIMEHVSKFAQMYKNPAFQGFNVVNRDSPAALPTAPTSTMPSTTSTANNAASLPPNTPQPTAAQQLPTGPSTGPSTSPSTVPPTVPPTSSSTGTSTQQPTAQMSAPATAAVTPSTQAAPTNTVASHVASSSPSVPGASSTPVPNSGTQNQAASDKLQETASTGDGHRAPTIAAPQPSPLTQSAMQVDIAAKQVSLQASNTQTGDVVDVPKSSPKPTAASSVVESVQEGQSTTVHSPNPPDAVGTATNVDSVSEVQNASVATAQEVKPQKPESTVEPEVGATEEDVTASVAPAEDQPSKSS